MKKSYLKYFTALVLFGSNGLAASCIALNSYEIVLLRCFFGVVLLLGIFFVTKHHFTAFVYKKDLLFIALSGAAMAADWLLLFEAYQQIGVSLGMIINYCGPAIVILLSVILFKEKITWPKLAALAAALSGACLISGQAVIGGMNLFGLFCAILSAFSYAAMVMFNKMSKQVKGMENAAMQLLCAFITAAVFVGCKQGFHLEIDSRDWLPILWLGFINTGIGCWLYFSSIHELPVQTVAICGYLEPLSAVLLSVVFLKEAMLPLQVAGAILIIGGAIFGECYPGKNAGRHGASTTAR